MRYLLIIILVFGLNKIKAQTSGKISGTVLSKTSQDVLPNATVFIEKLNLKSITDTNGNFRIIDIPVGTYNISCTLRGYTTQTIYNVVVTSGNEKTFTIELEGNNQNMQEVVVTTNNIKKSVRAATIETPLSVQRLTAEEIKANPGGNFDISKVIQSLPGVGGGISGGSFRNDILIRGGAPNENVFYLDGIEVPIINHFQTQGSSGGPQGILNVSFIEDVKLSSSSFDARFDNALSSVFEFKQRNGNPNKHQGNIRLSATELATTFEGPLSKSKKTTYLASARRSYLQLLFSAIDLPIRPSYWDFQAKITYKINNKTTLSFIGLGALDDFRLEAPKTPTPEKLYIFNSAPIIKQKSYTVGLSLKKLVNNGYWNLALSRNSMLNDINRWEDYNNPTQANRNLDFDSDETETKLRFDVNKNKNGWKTSYGASAQLAEFSNQSYIVLRKQLTNNLGQIIQPQVSVNFTSPLKPFLKLGWFAQAGKKFFEGKLGVNAGLRSDMNSFTTNGLNGLQTLSPRISFSYAFADKFSFNSSIGRYYKLVPYTILGFADNNNNLLNKNSKYTQSNHYTGGIEYLPSNDFRVTLEGFYKQYNNVPISVRNGISLATLGANFDVLGNEAVTTNGKGKAYGFEFFVQKKLTKKAFYVLSYTYYHSKYTNANKKYIASSWDNRHLLTSTFGYKFPRNWELGLKFRYQGGAPYTPFDDVASQQNYLSQGTGILNFNLLNTLRTPAFNSSDVRIDKKWNFKKWTLDIFLDVTNWYVAKSTAPPDYAFKRNADFSFATTDGQPIQLNGSNAIPVLLSNSDALTTPTFGFIVEF